MKLLRTAKASDKIRGWSVTDPHLVFFIYSYENEIDWNAVKNEKDIMQFIENNLMPKMHQKIDPESKSNNYFKTISDAGLEAQFQAYPNDGKIQAIAETYKTDKESARAQFVAAVNEKKLTPYFDWWNFFRQENPTYKSNPAFSYCMLRKMFDSSPEVKKEPIATLDPDVVQIVYEKIKNKPLEAINIEKTYGKESVAKNAKGMERADSSKNEGWLLIPRQAADPNNFDQNVKKLHDLSVGHGWCTAMGNELPYLKQGDFHLFIQNNICKAVVRLDGDKTVLEIRQENNYPALDYWEEVLTYIRRKKFITNKGVYQYNPCTELEAAEVLNKNLRDDPDYAEQFKRDLRGDINKYNHLSKDNKIKFASEAAKIWSQLISIDYDRFKGGKAITINLSGFLKDALRLLLV